MLRGWFLHHENTQSVQTGILTFRLAYLRANQRPPWLYGNDGNDVKNVVP